MSYWIIDIEIDGQMVAFKASAAIPRIYRLKFQRDIYKDLAVLEKSIGDGKEESSNLDMFSLEMFENIAFIMAKHADPSIPDTPEEWLDTNIRAHNFISKQYWQNNFNIVKEMLSQSEIYVYEEKSEIQGFVGLSDKHIEGIFVSSKVQSKGIGNLLMCYVKNIKNQLSLSVYQKNIRAVNFYQKEDFNIQSENVDENTGEKEYIMTWKRK